MQRRNKKKKIDLILLFVLLILYVVGHDLVWLNNMHGTKRFKEVVLNELKPHLKATDQFFHIYRLPGIRKGRSFFKEGTACLERRQKNYRNTGF